MCSIKIGVVAIFKNESMGIREWLTHYKEEGFDKAIILDNGSTDNYRDCMKDLESFITILDAPKRHYQAIYYNRLALPELIRQKIDIVAILDIDEFMFSLDGKTLRSRFEDFFSPDSELPTGFLCNWTMFGSSGYINQPSSIRKSFTKRQIGLNPHTKGVYRVKSLIHGGLGVHQSKVKYPLSKCPSGIQLNHYMIQSREFFEKVKMARGDVNCAKWDNIRDWNYFSNNDFDEIDDFSLSKRIIE